MRLPSFFSWRKSMANRISLTASNIRYLLAVQALDTGNGVRCVDLAAALNHSRPSVHNMMDTLSEMALVQRNAGGVITLSDQGRALAAQYSRYYEAVSGLLQRCFPEMENIQTVVCMMLSEVSPENLEHLACGQAYQTSNQEERRESANGTGRISKCESCIYRRGSRIESA